MPPDPTVSIVHSAREDLEDADVLALVRAAVEPLGGMGAFVQAGDTVVLKPNQTIWFDATEGITTDPRVVAALVQLAKEAGAGRIVVGDGSGGDLRSKRTLEATGVARLALDAGADEVVGFEDLPQGHLHLDLEDASMIMEVPQLLLDADVIVNVPKAKTHFEDAISCALKNWVGITEQRARSRMMQDPILWQATCRLHERVPAALHLVDGLVAGEGTGPVTNDPVWLGCVVAGTDPVAVDVTVARLLGFDADEVIFAKEGARIGLGVNDPARIRVVGAPVEDVAIRAKRSVPGLDHFPANVLVGSGVTMAGSVGHLKSIGETLLKYHFWDAILAVHGKPTFMVGAVEDPDFERHLEEGPYFVIDDAALDKYRTHPQVTFIPGHPATHHLFPYIWRRLGVGAIMPKAMDLKEKLDAAAAWFHFPSWKPAGEEPEVRGGELRG